MGKNKFATAPFNFIPLPSKVLIRYRNKEELPGHDRFYVNEDNTQFYSGEISYRIEISEDSALMIGGGTSWQEKLRKDEVVEWKWKNGRQCFNGQDFFKNADGKFAIPGNSIRGLLRQNVQILGLCHFKNDIEDSTYLFRDWTSDKDKKRRDYYKAAVGMKEEKLEEDKNEKTFVHLEKLNAGYIYMDKKNHYRICPAKLLGDKKFFKIAEEKLRPMVGDDSRVSFMYNEGLLKLKKTELKDKDKIKGLKNNRYKPYRTEVTFNTSNEQKRITEISLNNCTEKSHKGVLFSSGYVPLKRAHYVIGEMDRNSAEAIELDGNSKEIRGYNQDLVRTKKDANDFYMLPEKIGEEYKKPIFYVHSNGYTYIGMTPYLRILYPYSVWDGIPDTQNEAGLDYAQAMFGFHEEPETEEMEGNEAGAEGYRSRLSFTDAVQEEIKCGDRDRIVLGEPKATCYPEYLMQDEEEDTLNSYIDKFQIRGVKQYWLINGIRPHKKNGEKINPDIWKGFRPIIKGTFKGKIYFENLTGDELGLLLYGIKIKEGEEKKAWQTLGMAKAFGYGKIRFIDLNIKIYDFDKLYQNFFIEDPEKDMFMSNAPGPDDFIKQYKEYVQKNFKLNIEEEGSIQDFIYMKTEIMDQKITEYQNLNGFKDKKILPNVRSYRDKITKLLEEEKKMQTDKRKDPS